MRIELVGPPARLRTACLELTSDLQAVGATDASFDLDLLEMLAPRTPLRDGGTEFDLCVPLAKFSARLRQDRWDRGNGPLAEAELEPEAKRSNTLELRLER